MRRPILVGDGESEKPVRFSDLHVHVELGIKA